MKKFSLEILFILVAGFAALQFFPFWSIAIVGGLAGLLFRHENSAVSLAAGFVAASLLWGGYASYLDSANLHLLSEKMGEVFKVKGSYLAYLSGLAGGLPGGLGAMTGTLLRKVFEKAEVPTA